MRKANLLSFAILGISASTFACSGDASSLGGTGTGTPGAGSLSFEPAELLEQTGAAEVVEMDGDGTRDVVLHGKSGAVVYLNHDGAFSDPVTTPLSGQDYSPAAFGLVDVDNDGVVDAVTSQTIYYGAKDGRFGARSTKNQGLPYYADFTHDVDGDGYVDVIVSRSATVSAYSFDAGGKMTELFTVEAPLPKYVDINHDGKMDFVWVKGSTVVARLGTSATTFAPTRVLDTEEASLSAPTIVDIDHDDVLDLVVRVGSSPNAEFVLLRNQGDATFKRVKSFARAENVAYSFLDANGDGVLDIVLTQDEQMAVLPGRANGMATFGDPVMITGPWSKLGSFKFVDVNGDRKPDLVVSDDGGTSILRQR